MVTPRIQGQACAFLLDSSVVGHCCGGHAVHDDVVEGADDVEVERPGPSAVVDGRDDMKPVSIFRARRFYLEDQMGDQMCVLGGEHYECVFLAG